MTWSKILKVKIAGHLRDSIPTAAAQLWQEQPHSCRTELRQAFLEPSLQGQQDPRCLGQCARGREHREVTLNKSRTHWLGGFVGSLLLLSVKPESLQGPQQRSERI